MIAGIDAETLLADRAYDTNALLKLESVVPKKNIYRVSSLMCEVS